MNIQTLKPADGSRKKSVRIGRGLGSGIGKTCGKGHKGQNARSGGGVRPGFEGGQIPLVRKVPLRGFNNYNFKKDYSIINVGELNELPANTVVDAQLLLEKGIITKESGYGIKVLGNGELSVALTIKANKFSKQAQEKIKKAGGKIEVI